MKCIESPLDLLCAVARDLGIDVDETDPLATGHYPDAFAAIESALLAAEQRGAEGAEREAAHWKQTALTIQTNLAAQHRDECRSEWRRGHTEAFEDAATAYEGALREIGGLATYRDGADSYTTLGRKLDAIRARAIAAETGRTE
jgi:hypothetical protein